MKNSYAKEIRTDMVVKGYSQESLAKKIGVTQQTVHKWCNLEVPTKPTNKHIPKLLDALGDDSYFSKALFGVDGLAIEPPVHKAEGTRAVIEGVIASLMVELAKEKGKQK